MKIIDFEQIQGLNISPTLCYKWVEEVFRIKYESILPAKISIKGDGNVFVNTMPCKLPSISRYGVKVVSRYPNRNPALKSDIMLYDDRTGEMLALMDCSWITAMRTGAVAAMAIMTLKKSDAKVFGFMGLGNTARATLLCLMTQITFPIEIVLLAYKGQENDFIARFSEYSNLTFIVAQTQEELVGISDVVVSCVTASDTLIADDKFYKEGVLVVPVHTRGFQNCDLFFDKVVVDDIEHVRGFKYFDRFRSCCELSEVLLGERPGRESDQERVLAYNIGIAINDVYFASEIYDIIAERDNLLEIDLKYPTSKFWV